MMLAAYYLARRARRGPGGRTRPPQALGAPTWEAACDSFFEAPGDGRTPGQFRHSLQDARFNFAALLDNARPIRRNQRRRRKLDLYPRMQRGWKDRQDTELEALLIGFRDRAS